MCVTVEVSKRLNSRKAQLHGQLCSSVGLLVRNKPHWEHVKVSCMTSRDNDLATRPHRAMQMS